MLCPNCARPYLFLDDHNPSFAVCGRCRHRELFSPSEYDRYHQRLYPATNRRRNRRTDPQMSRIANVLRVSPDDRVVDLGCGVGDYTREMSILARSVIGVDLRIDEARRRSPELSFLEHDCNRPFPFPSGSVDVIISVNLIEHLADYRTCLEECARTLRTGGRIAMTTANLGFFLHDHFFDPTHVREWTLQEFGELMNQYFTTTILEKSSGMFKYYPINWVTTLFLKPDLLFVGVKG